MSSGIYPAGTWRLYNVALKWRCIVIVLTLYRRSCNIVKTSWSCIDVNATFLKRYDYIFRSNSACKAAQFDKSLFDTIANDSVSRRPSSFCADAQAELDLRCPHMPRRYIFTWLAPKTFWFQIQDIVVKLSILTFFFISPEIHILWYSLDLPRKNWLVSHVMIYREENIYLHKRLILCYEI